MTEAGITKGLAMTTIPKMWVGAQNDILYLIDKPPRPSNDDINPKADVNVIAKIYQVDGERQIADLFAEAATVANETGKTPGELREELAFLKSKGLTVGMMTEAGKEPYLAYVIQPGSELCDLETVNKLVDAEIANRELTAQRDELLKACEAFLARYHNHMVNADLLFGDIAEKASAAIAKCGGATTEGGAS